MIFDRNSDVLYHPDKSSEILNYFLKASSGLYGISGGMDYIFNTLNAPVYVQRECEKILGGLALADVADRLEMCRNLLFGECLDWSEIKAFIDDEQKAREQDA